MDIIKTFGENIRGIRKAQGLSQEALAEKAGLHRTYIGAIERGERNITLLAAYRITQALQVELSDCVQEDA